MKESYLEVPERIKFWKEDCVLRHDDQVLTIHINHPGEAEMIVRYRKLRYTLDQIYSTSIILADQKLVAEKKAADEKATTEAKKHEAEQRAVEVHKAGRDL